MTIRYIAGVVLLSVLAWAGGSQQQAQQSKPEPKKKEFAGSDTCAGCHDEISTLFKRNAHSALETNKKRGWDGKACEACHGPGSAHAESQDPKDIRSPKSMAAAEIDNTCLSCHKNTPTQVGRLMSGHSRNQVPCSSCHTIHKTGPESSSAMFKSAGGVTQKCVSCHTNVWASFQKPHHHKVPEGGMSCTGCHNPHASLQNVRNIRLANANEPGCMKCHSDKRGPFIYEHAPVKSQPCTICHENHGSVNPRMLTRAEIAPLCLECHSNITSPTASGLSGGVPPALHDMRSPRYRNCTICHQKIHGSNVNRALLR